MTHAHPHPPGHSPAHDVDDALSQLRAGGERITVARRAVLEQLAAAEGAHLPVDELTALVQEHNPDIHLSTVYRTLDFLTAAGIVVNVQLGPGPATYHFAGDDHHHALCDGCGAVIELPDDVLAPVIRRLVRDHGFSAHPHHVVLHGRCRTCSSS